MSDILALYIIFGRSGDQTIDNLTVCL